MNSKKNTALEKLRPRSQKEGSLKNIVPPLRMLVLTYLFMLIIRPHEIN